MQTKLILKQLLEKIFFDTYCKIIFDIHDKTIIMIERTTDDVTVIVKKYLNKNEIGIFISI